MKTTIKLLMMLSITLIMGCEDIPDSIQEYNDLQNEYELKEFSFFNEYNLDQDTLIRAKKVYFRFGSKVKINEFNLNIEADEIIFEQQSNLLAFGAKEYADCRQVGKNAGSVYITTQTISGSPFIDLAGQNAGQLGTYFDDSLVDPISPDHKKHTGNGRTWFDGCVKGHKGYPKDVQQELISRVGGNEGALFLNVTNQDDFTPLVSERVSHSSYHATVIGHSGKLNWWRDVPRGPDGLPTKICYLIEDEYLCKK